MLPTFRIVFVAAAVALLCVLITARGLIPEPEAYTRIGEVPSIGRPLMQQAMVPPPPTAMARQEEPTGASELTGLAHPPGDGPPSGDVSTVSDPNAVDEAGAAQTRDPPITAAVPRADAVAGGRDAFGAMATSPAVPSAQKDAGAPPPLNADPSHEAAQADALADTAGADAVAPPGLPSAPAVGPQPPATSATPAADPSATPVNTDKSSMAAPDGLVPAGSQPPSVDQKAESAPLASAALPPDAPGDLTSATAGAVMSSSPVDMATPGPPAASTAAAVAAVVETVRRTDVVLPGVAGGDVPPSLAFADETGHAGDAEAAAVAPQKLADPGDQDAANHGLRSRPRKVAVADDQAEAEPRRSSAGRVTLKRKSRSARKASPAKREVSSRRSRQLKRREARRSAAAAARKKRRVVRHKHRSERRSTAARAGTTQKGEAATGIHYVPAGYQVVPGRTSGGYSVYYQAPAQTKAPR